jgi:TrmH family RNA methyltransferase
MFPRRTHTSALTRLTSTKNPLLRDIRKAVERGSLTSGGLCVAEGFHLLEEARRSRCELVSVLVADSVSADHDSDYIVPDEVLASVSSTENSQGVLALVRPAEYRPDDLFTGVPMVLVLDGIQDPGNAGTLIRTAEAFGATGVLLTPGSVNPWNPKALRASAGSAFRMPLIRNATPDLLEGRTLGIWAAMPRQAAAAAPDFTRPSVLVIGSEARGVSREWAGIAEPVTIATHRVESLNAAIAGSILLYEADRQRMLDK